MADWSYDLAAAPEEDEVLLAFAVGDDVSRVLARRAWFPSDEKGVKVQGWASTFTGERLPAEWSIFAWTEAPVPPDPDGF